MVKYISMILTVLISIAASPLTHGGISSSLALSPLELKQLNSELTSNIPVALEHICQILEKKGLIWELLPSGFRSKTEGMEELSPLFERINQWGGEHILVSWIQEQLNPNNPASLLHPSGYHSIASPYPLKKKTLFLISESEKKLHLLFQTLDIPLSIDIYVGTMNNKPMIWFDVPNF